MPREARGCRTRPCDPTGNHDGLTSHRVALRRCLKAPTGQWRTEDPTPRQSRKSRQGSASADLAWIMLCKVPPPLGSSKTRFEEGSGAFFQHAFEEGWKLCLIVLPASMWPPTPVRPARSAMPAMSIMISPGWAGHASLAWRLAWPGPAALPAQASMAGTGRRSKPKVLRHTVVNSGKSVSQITVLGARRLQNTA